MCLCDNLPHVKNISAKYLQFTFLDPINFAFKLFLENWWCQGESFLKSSKILYRVF